MAPENFSVTGTPWGLDRVSPIELRSNGRTRLVFKPTVIENNPKNPEAFVNGVFVFQTKKPSEVWVDVDSIKLNTLKSGEGVRLDLSSSEVLLLHRKLTACYQLAKERGIIVGTTNYIAAPENEGMRRLIETGQFDKLSGDEKIDLLSDFVTWLTNSEAQSLAVKMLASGTGAVANFDAALGAARLTSFVEAMRANKNNPDEAYWDGLLTENSWALSQIFAQPLIIVGGQAYMGGKNFDNRGGNVADFLFQNPVTANPAVIEIKTPATDLLTSRPYRNTAYQPSHDMAGAIAQVLHATDKLKEEYSHLGGDEGPIVRAFHPKALLLIGDIELQQLTNTQKRSFELYRGSMPFVDIVTFDELELKASTLLSLLET
jgi:hypothetical protein